MVEVLMGSYQQTFTNNDQCGGFTDELGTTGGIETISFDPMDVRQSYASVPLVRPVTSKKTSVSSHSLSSPHSTHSMHAMHPHGIAAPTRELPKYLQMSDLVDYAQLAKQYMQQGRAKEAENLYIQALAVAEQSLGEQHEALQRHLDELSNFYLIRAKYTQAEPFMERLLSIRSRTLVPNDALLIKTVDDLAFIYENNGKIRQSEALYKFLMARQEEAFGRQSVCVAITTERLARCYCRQREFRAAETLFEFALKVRESIFGQNSIELSAVMQDFAGVYQELGKLDLSAMMIARQLNILEKVHGCDNLSVASCLLRLAELLTKVNLPDDAEPLYLRVVGIYQRAYGEDTCQLRSVNTMLAQVQVDQKNAKFAMQNKLVEQQRHNRVPAAASEQVKPAYRAVSEMHQSVYHWSDEDDTAASDPTLRTDSIRFLDAIPMPPPQLAAQLETARQPAVKTIAFSPTFCDSPIPQAPCLF